MSEPFQPNEGDTVEFYNTEAELWETGIVSSHAADRRIYFVQPDDESQSGWLVNHTNIRPVSATEPAVPSFWEAAKTFCRTARVSCDLANALQAQIDAFPLSTGSLIGDKVAARIAEHRERAEKAEADLARFHGVLVPQRDLDEMTEARDYWKEAAESNLRLVGVRSEEVGRQRARAEKAETRADNETRRVQGYGELVEKLRNRAEKAEANLQATRGELARQTDRAEKAEAQLRKSVDQSNTHSGHLNDALRNERARADRLAEILDQTITERDAMTRRAISAEDRAEYAETRLRNHTAETWTDHDGTVRPLGGITRAELARQMYDENERAGREKARADKLATELSELKAAIRTLAGDSE